MIDINDAPAAKPKLMVNPTDGPTIRFPPFPVLPPNAREPLIPFKNFKEHGIRVFSDTDVEVDGLGIPTIELGVRHELDECKTKTRRKVNEENKRGSGNRTEEPAKVNPPIERRHQRFLLFAKKEWYDQWSEDEYLRGLNTFDPNLSTISRIHLAATDFRKGRIWPPAHTHLLYLWDQFRLYAGLLGTTPIWTRTDLPQPEDEDAENEVEDGSRPSALPRHKKPCQNLDDELDLASDFSDHDELTTANIKLTEPNSHFSSSSQPPRKRVTPRAPYELYNKDPIPVSSDAEVRALLARAALRKEAKLLAFLNDPEKSVKVFLSSYMRREGLIWTPSFLTYLPHLVSFFLSFLIRTRALPECERQLKRAITIAQEATTELPRTGRLCRILPDAMGKGAKNCWGTKWEEKWDFGITQENNSNISTEPQLNNKEALKMFEDEVKRANLQLFSKETVFEPEQFLANKQSDDDDDDDDDDIDIRIMSPETETPTACVHELTATSPKDDSYTWGKPERTLAPSSRVLADDSPPPSPPAQLFQPTVSLSNPKGKEAQISDDDGNKGSEEEEEEEDPRSWASPLTRSQKLADKAAWFPLPTQPLMEILGMTVLPLRYESGIAERSLRKVISILKPGEGVGGGSKWRGVEEELVKRFARVVLAPWPDWDDGGVAPEFKTPTLVGGGTSKGKEGDEKDANAKLVPPIGHDPLEDHITILVEPNVINSLNVGMGVAGTWVQMIPLRSEHSGVGGRGHTRGGDGGGRGKGRNRGKEQKFWYVEELSMAIPSFWTVGEEIEEIEVDEEDIDSIGRR